MNQKQAMLQRFQRLQHSEEERASPAMLGKQGQTAQAVKRTYQRKQILHENTWRIGSSIRQSAEPRRVALSVHFWQIFISMSLTSGLKKS